MATYNYDVLRVLDAEATITGGGIKQRMFAFATDTSKLIVRDSLGYHKAPTEGVTTYFDELGAGYTAGHTITSGYKLEVNGKGRLASGSDVIDLDTTGNSISLTDGSSTSSITLTGLTLPAVSSPSHTEGLMFYDTDNKSYTYYNDESEVAMQVGQELWMRVKNNTGSTINNGELVYVSGDDSGIPTVALANANSSATCQGTIGFATHDIETATTGYITFAGAVRGLNTAGCSAGDPLYLDTTDGQWTTTAPSSPNYVVRLGVCSVSHATTGEIEAALDIGDNTQDNIKVFNGLILEDRTVLVDSDGVTITCTIEKTGGGDLTIFADGGYVNFDCTPIASVNLTAGTDAAPVLNYVYIPQSTNTLTASTSGWPAGEHAPVCTALCQSAASLQTYGAYKVHEWTEHLDSSVGQGHLSELNKWIRNQNATYLSGVDVTISGSGTGTVGLSNTSGTALQLHEHTFPAFVDPAPIYVVNDSVTPYTRITNIVDIDADSTGASLNNSTFGLVLWAVASEDEADCKWYCNLPSGSYGVSKPADVRADNEEYTSYNIPLEFRGTAFLVHRLVISRNAGGTVATVYTDSSDDIRGLLPNQTAGGSGGSFSLTVDTGTGLSGAGTSGDPLIITDVTTGSFDFAISKERIRVNSTENYNWGTSFGSIQFEDASSISGFRDGTTDYLYLTCNAYKDGGSTWRYGHTDEATLLTMVDGTLTLNHATSGTGGDGITWSTRFTADGDGITIPDGDIVNGTPDASWDLTAYPNGLYMGAMYSKVTDGANTVIDYMKAYNDGANDKSIDNTYASTFVSTGESFTYNLYDPSIADETLASPTTFKISKSSDFLTWTGDLVHIGNGSDETWDANHKVIQLGTGSMIYTDPTDSMEVYIASNLKYDTTLQALSGSSLTSSEIAVRSGGMTYSVSATPRTDGQTITDLTTVLDVDINGLLLENGTRINEISIDGTLGGDSDDAVPTEKAVKTYADGLVLWSGDGTTLSPSGTETDLNLPAGGIFSIGGYSTLKYDPTWNIFLGDGGNIAGMTTAAKNIGIGSLALNSLTTGLNNMVIGHEALKGITTSGYNMAIGVNSLRSLTSGDSNVAIGDDAGRYFGSYSALTTSNDSIYIGALSRPLANTTTNEIVIGKDTIGKGSNTVLIGTSSTTTTFLQGDGHIQSDSKKMLFGAAAGGDASIMYNGTNMVFDSQETGTGDFVFSNGSMVIGHTAASGKLHIRGEANYSDTVIRAEKNNGERVALIGSDATGTDGHGQAILYTNTDASGLLLNAGTDSWFTNNVTIGSSTVGTRVLNIYHESASQLSFQSDSTGRTATDGTFIGLDSVDQTNIWNYENKAMLFGTNNATRMTIEAGGDVTIENGVLALVETTTPTAVGSEGRIYTKSDNKLYFQDGAGTEHEIAFV